MKKIREIFFNGTKNLLRWFYKKKPRLFIILFLIFISGFYLLGVLFPLKPIRPYLVDNGVTINDLLTRLFQLLAAIATFTSAFVALFRDELRRKFLEIQKVNVDFVEVDRLGEDTLNEEGETDEKKVVKYLCELEFKNLGNVHEKGCEIYIQNIRIKNSINEKAIKRSYSLLQWDNSKQTKILIPIKGKVYLTAFTILPPQEIKEDDSDTTAQKEVGKSLPPILKITDNVEFKANEIKDVEVRIEYLLCFENNQPKEFNLVVKWDGSWKSRIPEMKEKISINLEFPKNV
jgi:hypothetical protein